MKFKILLTIGVFAILFFSCEKDEDNNSESDNKIEIFPGVGAAKMKLGDTYGKLSQIYGSYDKRMIFDFNQGAYYMNYLTFDSIKANFNIYGYSSSLNDNDIIISIEVEAPYDGLTEELIGIGSTLKDVVVAYGEPTEIVESYSNYYKYESLKTVFNYDDGGTLVTGIKIYDPIYFPGI